MVPLKTLIELERESQVPVYIQIANSVAREIRNGILKPGSKLPGARSLAELVDVNRNTIVAAYTELNLQGYVELFPKKGAFISKRIPDIKPKRIPETSRKLKMPETAGFELTENVVLPLPAPVQVAELEFNDGLPDERIAPMEELTRNYRLMFRRSSRVQFGYSDVEGNLKLRKELSKYLNETRGLQTSFENVFITKGSQMGIYLISQLLLKRNDTVVVASPNYQSADLTFLQAGARLEHVGVDKLGIDVDAIEEICAKKRVRAVYVTPHHHFPTTITMSACRRMKLLELATRWKFAILEDDYDYDFHYKSSPILPLASADHQGMVINIGSLSKNFSPALRLAYVVAPVNVIRELTKLRFIIDRQGDYLLEQSVAELFADGTIKRHLKKAVRIYHQRRDSFCELLRQELGHLISFSIPDGGLAVWVNFDPSVDLLKVAKVAIKKGLKINSNLIFIDPANHLNNARLGFASLNKEEQKKAVGILKAAIVEVLGYQTKALQMEGFCLKKSY